MPYGYRSRKQTSCRIPGQERQGLSRIPHQPPGVLRRPIQQDIATRDTPIVALTGSTTAVNRLISGSIPFSPSTDPLVVVADLLASLAQRAAAEGSHGVSTQKAGSQTHAADLRQEPQPLTRS